MATAGNTKDRILDVAETLFADNGFAATSLRDITREAGVNIAAVNYHFGSKDGLLGAVLERRIAPVNRQRLELLDRAESEVGSDGADLEALVRALLAPAFQRLVVGDGAAQFLRLAGRLHSEPHEQARAVFLAQFGEVIRRFVPAFRKALPHLDQDEASWRFLFVIGAMAHTMISSHMFEVQGNRQPPDLEQLLEALVQFAVAGIKAPAAAARTSNTSGAVV
jgi:AcrR family transcriptional regulator